MHVVMLKLCLISFQFFFPSFSVFRQPYGSAAGFEGRASIDSVLHQAQIGAFGGRGVPGKRVHAAAVCERAESVERHGPTV